MRRKQMRRWISLVLALCLTISSLPAMAVNASSAESDEILYQQNLITNGGFEEFSNDTPVDWELSQSNGASISKTAMESDFLYYGNGESPYMFQSVMNNIGGGKTYTFSAQVKRMSSAVSPFVDIQTNGIAAQTNVYRFYETFGTAVGEWETISITFTTQQDVTWVKVRLGSRGDLGLIYWDDLSLCEENSSVNLISNGDFEGAVKKHVPEGWSIEAADWVKAGVNYGLVGTVAEGTSAVTFDGADADTAQWASQEIANVEAGTAYTVSGKVLTDEVGNDVTPELTVTYLDADGNAVGAPKSVDCSNVEAGKWADVAIEAEVPAGAVKAKISVGASGAGVCTWDDIQFVQTNLLSNGGFEAVSGGEKLPSWTISESNGTVGIVGGDAELMLTWEGSVQPYMCQKVEGLKGNTTYTLTVQAKSTSGSKPFMDIQTNGYTSQTNVYRFYDTFGTAVGEWETISITFTTQSDVTWTNIRLGFRGSAGTILWDDVTLCESGSEENLVQNGDFEGNVKAHIPAGWTLEATDATAGTHYDVIQNTVKASAELMLTWEGSVQPYMCQKVEGLKGNTTYTLTVQAKSTSGSKPFMDIQTNGYTSQTNVYRFYDTFGTAVGEWETISITFTTQSDVTWTNIRLGFRGSAGTILWDDVTLCESGSEENLVQNGDFEGNVKAHIPAGWTLEATDATAGTHYDVLRNAVAGASSVVIAGQGAAISQKVESLTDDAPVYALAAMLYKESAESLPVLNVTYYDAQEQALGAAQAADCSSVPVGAWTQVSLESTVPAGAVSALITVASNSDAGSRWDDVRFALPTEQEPIDPDELAAQQTQAFLDMLDAEAAAKTEEITIERTTGYLPPCEGQSNLLKNGSFEENNDTTAGLANWTSSNEAWAMLAVGEGYNGSDCLKYSPWAEKAENPTFKQSVKVVGGAEYQISFKYRLSGTVGTPAVKFECWSDKDKPGAQHIEGITAAVAGNELADGADRNNIDSNQWYTYTGRFYPSSNTVDVDVYVRWLANGSANTDNSVIWIDDVELYMVNPPKVFELKTDSVFYYSDDAAASGAVGTITTAIDTNYFADMANSGSYTFELKDPNASTPVLWTTTGIATNGNCTATFPLNLMTEKEHRYEIVATLYEDDGTTVLQREVQSVYVYDRVGSLDVNGNYHPWVYDEETGEGQFASEVFYPEFGYHVTCDLADQYKALAETGINLVQISAFYSVEATLYMLDCAQEAGVMGMLCFYKNMQPAAHVDNIEMTVKVINAVKNHPAVYGYTVMDESFLALSDPAQELENAFRLIRSLDPNHPVMVMEVVERYFVEAAKYVDILFIDPYSQAYTQHVGENTQLAVQSVADKKPVYALLEAFRTGTGRYPTANDLRNNIWQALISGASAVGYYTITDSDLTTDASGNITYIPIWDAEDGRLWDVLKEFKATSKTLAYDHFVFDKTPVFNEYIGEDYWYSSWQVDNAEGGKDLYMVVLSMLEEKENGNSATQQVSIPLTSTDESISIAQFQATPVSGRAAEAVVTGTGKLDLTLTGSEAILFKITEVEAPARVAMHSLLLEGNIGINFWTKLSDSVLTDPDAYIQFTMPNQTVKQIPVSEGVAKTYSNGETYYIFNCEVAAKEMTDEITAQIFYTGGSSEVDKFTVRKYADLVLADSEATAELKALVTSMLHYGAYAQKHFGYQADADTLADKGLEACELSGVTLATLEPYASASTGTDAAKFSAISLLLNANTDLRFFFTLDDSVTDFKVTGINGEELKVKERDGMHYVDVTAVAAQYLDQNYTVTIHDGEDETTVSASALSYCYTVLKAAPDDETLKDLVKALFLYNQAADNYFQNNF